jgi:uncharacterized damage-inducible protein DinB
MATTTREKPKKKQAQEPDVDGGTTKRKQAADDAASTAKRKSTDDSTTSVKRKSADDGASSPKRTSADDRTSSAKRKPADDGARSSKRKSVDDTAAEAKSKRPARARSSKTRAAKSAGADAAIGNATSKPNASPSKRARSAREPVDLGQAVLQALATNERMNQYLLENLDERAWTLPPASGKGRTIAAIVAHMHNVRHMWLVVAAKGTKIPDKLDRASVTKPQAMKALEASGQALLALFERALENGNRVKDFRPDVVGFLGYVTAHEAHHRGQICMLARELELPLSKDASYGMWDWNKRWKECGFGK